MQKKLVQSSLAMAAAAALGLGGAFVASPAAADQPEVKVSSENAVQTAVYKNLSTKDGALVPEVGRFGVDGGDLVIGVSKKSEQVKAFSSKYDNVEVVVDPRYVKVEPQAAKDLVGGAGYMVNVPSDPNLASVCSTGFAGWDAQGNQVVLTAGHCAVDTSDGAQNKIIDLEKPSIAEAVGGEGFQPAGTGAPGTWGFHQYGSDIVDGTVVDEQKAIDFAVIEVADDYTTKPEVTDWTTAESDDLSKSTTEVTEVGAATPGASISKSGRTTGVTEGTVLDDSEGLEYANIGGRAVHGFEVTSGAERFSDHGDSGGAVYQGDTAVGVISGGPETGEWTWVADLENSIEKSGATFTLEKPDDGGDDDAKQDADADADAKDAEADAGADGKDADASAAADGDDAKADADADAKDAEADAGADGKDADASAAADGDDAKADADADAKDAEADADADGKDADASSAADGKDDNADSDADGNEKPEAPKVGDQTVVEGGQITGQAAPNVEVELTWKSAEANAGSAQAVPANGNTTVKTDANGKFTAEAPAEAGDYNYTAVVHANGQESAPAEFVVTVEAEEAPAERKLSIDPKEVAASDFVQQDKGVQITAEGFDEGEKVTLEVVGGPENVEGITLDEVANGDGVVGFSIYGTNASDPSAYLGKYDLEVTGANDTDEEDALTGSFSVVADEDGNGGGNGGDDDGNGDGGSDLPRTGAELTGLAAGAGLLVVGGTAVVLTMRRKKNN